ncbi:hypothetical protein [Nocardiopsis aegyptia]|uniref:Uncharacterized protein n=1 Tax=Nocardiopsis aegyptia TaxID=220378 RepID=A0A7Z0ENL4_9ACTN|nr:hypothetical protein [Nocardiopsis aegyptia]NYJ34588.1 hypothetical protein [Nocardiopsis aegyptia]
MRLQCVLLGRPGRLRLLGPLVWLRPLPLRRPGFLPLGRLVGLGGAGAVGLPRFPGVVRLRALGPGPVVRRLG